MTSRGVSYAVYCGANKETEHGGPVGLGVPDRPCAVNPPSAHRWAAPRASVRAVEAGDSRMQQAVDGQGRTCREALESRGRCAPLRPAQPCLKSFFPRDQSGQRPAPLAS
ncbi:hypothetical protein VTN02DRAFT_4992 [Thermoascus thermophilus]